MGDRTLKSALVNWLRPVVLTGNQQLGRYGHEVGKQENPVQYGGQMPPLLNDGTLFLFMLFLFLFGLEELGQGFTQSVHRMVEGVEILVVVE